jgi:hypothetical protein
MEKKLIISLYVCPLNVARPGPYKKEGQEFIKYRD